jgi:hypothetical protein
MLISETRRRVEGALLSFGWEQWSQMGILALARSESPWAQDPEALLIFTLEVARVDPRLFDEILDWLLTNEHLISVRRLRSLASDPVDRSLVEAALTWVRHQRSGTGIGGDPANEPAGPLEPVHFDVGFTVRRPDAAFAAHGWLRPSTAPSGKGRPPDMRAPINFAFRMRQLLGVGARAEAVRFLLTTDVPRPTTRTIAKSAGYAKRNVQEALNDLAHAGVVTISGIGNEQRHGTRRETWSALLELDELPTHVDWIQLLAGQHRALRWLRRASDRDISEYLLASEALDLIENLRPDLEYAGIPVPRAHTSAEALQVLSRVLDASLTALQEPAARDLHYLSTLGPRPSEATSSGS